MKNFIFTIVLGVLAVAAFPVAGYSHDGEPHVKLHVNPRWSECSFQLDSSLSQEAWRQFTQEAGLVAYFRPLRDATSMGAGNYEISILQWATNIDDSESAWNDTFVHPDSAHVLTEGDRLAFPGLTFRAGITDKIDVGAYWTKNFNANYGFWGAQVQYGFVQDTANRWAASTRLSVSSLYGPEDLGLFVTGLDLLVSKEFNVHSDWISIAPYAGASTYLSYSHETSGAVDLRDERVGGVQGMVGAVAKISAVRLAAEYNVARLSTISFKIGVGF